MATPPQVKFSPQEIANLLECISLGIASAKRGHNTAKNPDIKRCHAERERQLAMLELKISGQTDIQL